MDNHSNRPEIMQAIKEEQGVSIRRSKSTGQEYYYLAQQADGYILRSSVIYNPDVIAFLKANSLFFYYIIGLFVVIGALLYLVTKKFSQGISKLQEVAISMTNNERTDITFKDDEIGFIGTQLVNVYGNLQDTQQALSVEKERIYRHLNAVNEGIAIFSSEKDLLISSTKEIDTSTSIVSCFQIVVLRLFSRTLPVKKKTKSSRIR